MVLVNCPQNRGQCKKLPSNFVITSSGNSLDVAWHLDVKHVMASLSILELRLQFQLGFVKFFLELQFLFLNKHFCSFLWSSSHLHTFTTSLSPSHYENIKNTCKMTIKFANIRYFQWLKNLPRFVYKLSKLMHLNNHYFHCTRVNIRNR